MGGAALGLTPWTAMLAAHLKSQKIEIQLVLCWVAMDTSFHTLSYSLLAKKNQSHQKIILMFARGAEHRPITDF
jgi:hypothetical protein